MLDSQSPLLSSTTAFQEIEALLRREEEDEEEAGKGQHTEGSVGAKDQSQTTVPAANNCPTSLPIHHVTANAEPGNPTAHKPNIDVSLNRLHDIDTILSGDADGGRSVRLTGDAVSSSLHQLLAESEILSEEVRAVRDRIQQRGLDVQKYIRRPPFSADGDNDSGDGDDADAGVVDLETLGASQHPPPACRFLKRQLDVLDSPSPSRRLHELQQPPNAAASPSEDPSSYGSGMAGYWPPTSADGLIPSSSLDPHLSEDNGPSSSAPYSALDLDTREGRNVSEALQLLRSALSRCEAVLSDALLGGGSTMNNNGGHRQRHTHDGEGQPSARGMPSFSSSPPLRITSLPALFFPPPTAIPPPTAVGGGGGGGGGGMMLSPPPPPPRASLPSRSSPSPSSYNKEALEASFAAAEEVRRGVLFAIRACEESMASYTAAAADLRQGWAEQRRLWDEDKALLIRQLREKNVPIPPLV